MLRDGFALTAAGGYAEFGQVADAVLRELLAGSPEWKGDLGTAVSYVSAPLTANTTVIGSGAVNL